MGFLRSLHSFTLDFIKGSSPLASSKLGKHSLVEVMSITCLGPVVQLQGQPRDGGAGGCLPLPRPLPCLGGASLEARLI